MIEEEEELFETWNESLGVLGITVTRTPGSLGLYTVTKPNGDEVGRDFDANAVCHFVTGVATAYKMCDDTLFVLTGHRFADFAKDPQ